MNGRLRLRSGQQVDSVKLLDATGLCGAAFLETLQYALTSFQLWGPGMPVKVCGYQYQNGSSSLDLLQHYTYF